MLLISTAFSFAVSATFVAVEENKLQPCKRKSALHPVLFWAYSIPVPTTYARQGRQSGVEELLRLALRWRLSTISEARVLSALARWQVPANGDTIKTHPPGDAGAHTTPRHLLWPRLVLLLLAPEELLLLVLELLRVELLVATVALLVRGRLQRAHAPGLLHRGRGRRRGM